MTNAQKQFLHEAIARDVSLDDLVDVISDVVVIHGLRKTINAYVKREMYSDAYFATEHLDELIDSSKVNYERLGFDLTFEDLINK